MRCERAALALALGIAVVLVVDCTTEQNPFADVSNARAVFYAAESDFAPGDSVRMFTTYRMSVVVLVSELVDSFAVHADTSYRCSDTVVRRPGTESYVFTVAFADTGTKRIRLTTFRRGGDRAAEDLTVRVYSPLRQSDLAADIGDELVLSTEPVGDSVQYYWSVGDDSTRARDTIRAAVWQVRTRILTVGTLPGRLWVSTTARGRLFVSPAVPFRVTLDDKSGPQIVCLNDTRNDTIVTGAQRFVFLVNVSDGGGVEQVTVNGVPPLQYVPGFYRTELTGLDSIARGGLPIAVGARDRTGNVSQRTFVVVYDPQAANLQRTQVFVKSVPGGATGRDRFLLIGGVREYLRPFVYITAAVNGSGCGETLRVAMEGMEAEFSMVVRLTAESNEVVLLALDSNRVALADTSVTIIYRADYVDNRPPTLMSVTAAGKRAEAGAKVYAPDTAATVVIRAFDESGIASVRLNGQECPLTPGSAYEWRGTAGPLAYGAPLPVALVLRDSAGQELTHQFLLQKNVPPAMPSGWVWPWRLFVGSPLELTFTVLDEEERATVRLENAPASMSVHRTSSRNEWTIRWAPGPADTGEYLTRVVLDDSLESVTLPWQFKVLRDSSGLVRFLTLPSAFPRYLEAGRETLQVTLSAAPGTGTPPFTFTAELPHLGRLLLSTASASGSAPLVWQPQEGDTGVHHLTVTLIDNVGDRDRLDRDIEVVPRNRYPCRLLWTRPEGIDTTAFGELDMRTAPGPVSIRFTIDDSDHPYTERYVRTVSQRGACVVDTLGSRRTFVVTLDTSYAIPHDTLVVTVADRTGGRDTVRIPLLYRYAPPRFAATWRWPVRFIAGVEYALDVGVVSPFHPARLTLSGGPAAMAFAPGGTSESWTLRYAARAADSGVYHTAVTLADPYVDTTIGWSFVVLADSSRLLRFAPDAGVLPAYATAERPLVWTLNAASGAGTPPLRYRVYRLLANAVVLDTAIGEGRAGVVVSWTPAAADTGRQLLIMSVCDSLGDADTIVREIVVLPANRYPCRLTMARSSGSDTTLDGAINMAVAIMPCTLRFVIEDRDHPLTERYTAFITRDGITSVQPLDTSRAFEIVIGTSPERWGYDTIRVVVLDASGTSSMMVVRVWYGVALPTVSGGARLEVHMTAVPAQMNLVKQDGVLFVNVWRGSPGRFTFGANTFGGSPPVLDTVTPPSSVVFTRNQGSNLIAPQSRTAWSWIDSAFTLFVVARPDQVFPGRNYCLLATTDADIGYMSVGVADGYAGAFSSVTSSKSTIQVSAGRWHIFTYSSAAGRQMSTLTVNVWVDGAAGGPCTVNETFTGYHTMLGATVRSQPSHVWDGRIAEVLMYRGRLAETDRRQVEAYLALRYAIALQ